MMTRIYLSVCASLFLLAGCYSTTEGCRPKPLPAREADYIALQLMADYINASQTNWTVIIQPRTNYARTNRESGRQ